MNENLDKLTGYLCDDCYDAAAKGDDLSVVDDAASSTIDHDRDGAIGYIECLSCNEVAVGGYRTTLLLRP